MSFDLERFRGAALAPHQAIVPVPDLAHWFNDAPAEWIVRGLTGEEIARSNEASARHKLVGVAVEALASASAAPAQQTEALKELLGYGGSVPEDLAKRLDHLVFCSIQPVIDRDIAVRLFAHYPVVAFTLTNKILELTGLGADVGKAPHSTAIPA